MSHTEMIENNRGIVWAIGGSDCTGGAGIQADCKTIHNLGTEVCTIITAVTAQNSLGVDSINPVSLNLLEAQLGALYQDKPASVIKIGMLANSAQVELIAEWIRACQNNYQQMPRVIYDPVISASAGGELAEDDILPSLKKYLLPLVDVLTPNAKEAQRLSGVYIIQWQSMLDACHVLQKMGVGSVVLKGGHIDIDPRACVDLANNSQQQFWLYSARIDSEHSHGSGCTFASAIAALIAQGYLLRDAFTVAKAYINQGLRHSANYNGVYGGIWQGGWPTNIHDYPQVITPKSKLARQLAWDVVDSYVSYASDFASCGSQQLGLYPVVDSVDWVKRLLACGIKTIQLRLKNLPLDQIEQAIEQAVMVAKPYQARLFINDYWQLAIKYQAYGVHLGQEDIQQADLQAIKNAGLRLGVSTHGEYEFLAACAIKPSYIAVGAIFPTQTKDMSDQIQGVTRLKRYVNLNVEQLPMVAIGGINIERLNSVLDCGVGSVAMVSAITQADNPEQIVATIQTMMKAYAIN